MSSVKFGFNEALLNYLENEGNFLFEDNFTESERYRRYIQLNVAKTFNNIPFFIPLQAD